MRVLKQINSEPHPCHYLADRTAILEYSVAPALRADEYEELMNRGYRKFGPVFFRPVCEGCRECRPVRIPVARFRPDRSQRRCWKANQDLEVQFSEPTLDEERLELYTRYHASQADRKGWPDHERDPGDYYFHFVQNPLPAVEVSFWEGDRLRAVLLTDVTPNVVSGVYHYWDPECAARGLGTFCMLHTLELARQLKKQWAYFGYYVAGCGSLAYKSRFRPCEILGTDGNWQLLEG
jgi:arginyl-tRNA--protein-N-Asp/Glu arginylyltransferase